MSASAIEMLSVAARYIRDHCPDGLVYYNDADCDGYCVADDCEVAADEILAATKERDELKAENERLRKALNNALESLSASHYTNAEHQWAKNHLRAALEGTST